MDTPRILIIAAAGMFGQTVTQHLRGAGYAVAVAHSHAAAQDMLAAGLRADLIVECRDTDSADWSPLRTLRRSYHSIPVVVALDSDSAAAHRGAARAGAACVVTRHPRFADNVPTAIARALAESRAAGNCQPFAEPPQCGQEKVPERPARAAGQGSARILLVEDSEPVRQLSCTALVRAGYQVALAASAEEALERLDDGTAVFDLLITDVVLPGMSGPELVTRLEQRGGCRAVVFMSGYTKELLGTGQYAGKGRRFLAKPFSLGDLRTTVAAALQDGNAPAGAAPGQAPQPAIGQYLTGHRHLP